MAEILDLPEAALEPEEKRRRYMAVYNRAHKASRLSGPQSKPNVGGLADEEAEEDIENAT